jgi:hypothetical protein
LAPQDRYDEQFEMSLHESSPKFQPGNDPQLNTSASVSRETERDNKADNSPISGASAAKIKEPIMDLLSA